MPHAIRLCLRLIFTLSGFRLVVLFCIFYCTHSAHADSSTRQIHVTEADGIYTIEVSQELDVDSHYVNDVLTDVMHVYRLNPSIIESEILGSDGDNGVRVRTKLLCCLPVFCREVERVDVISLLATGEIQATLIPEQSDFQSGKATWKITPLGDNHTHLSYTATIEPKFFIPPVIGVQVVKKNLNEEFGITFDRIERIASVNAERDWHHEIHATQLALRSPATKPCEDSLRANLQ